MENYWINCIIREASEIYIEYLSAVLQQTLYIKSR